MKLFVDANTLVSGVLYSGNERVLLELGRLGLCELVTNDYVWSEVREVLSRRHLALSPPEQRGALAFLAQCVSIVADPSAISVKAARGRLNDEKDLPVLLGFEEAGCDLFVTGDRRFRRQVPQAITTKVALRKILEKVG